jgi:hypothetical protein
MKKNLIYLLLIAIAIFFASCNENKDTGEYKKFSKLSPEQHKENIQNTGIELVNKVSDFAFSKGVKVSVQAVNMMSKSQKSFSQKSKVIYPIGLLYNLAQVQNDKSAVYDLMLSLKKFKLENDEDSTAQQIFESNAGTYTWNFTKKDFDFNKSTNKTMIINFPSDSTKKTNNATFTISKFETLIVTDPEEMEMPKNVSANLTVDGTKEVEISFAGSYNTKGVPLSVDASLTVSGYSFTFKLENDASKKASAEYAFNKGSEKLMGLSFGANGAWNESDITNNTHYYEYKWNEKTWNYDKSEITKAQMYRYPNNNDYYYEEEIDFEEIVQKSYGFIDILDLRAGGEVNIKALVDKEKELENKRHNDSTYNEEKYIDDMITPLNENTDFYIAYNSDKRKIADMEFYSYMKDFEENRYVPTDSVNMGGYWYYTNYGYVKVTVKRKTISANFIFGDGSKVDAETYFKDGFDKFIEEINNFIKDLSKEYGLEIE